MSEYLQLQLLHEIDKLTSKKYAETINLLFTGNKLFVTCQTKGGLTPPTTLAYVLGRQYKDNGFGQSELSRNTTLNMRSGRKVYKMWWDGFWMETITQISTKT